MVVCMLKGAFMFFADIVRHITIKHKTDFLIVSSYSGTQTTGNVKIKQDLSLDPWNHHILIIEGTFFVSISLFCPQNKHCCHIFPNQLRFCAIFFFFRTLVFLALVGVFD